MPPVNAPFSSAEFMNFMNGYDWGDDEPEFTLAVASVPALSGKNASKTSRYDMTQRIIKNSINRFYSSWEDEPAHYVNSQFMTNAYATALRRLNADAAVSIDDRVVENIGRAKATIRNARDKYMRLKYDSVDKARMNADKNAIRKWTGNGPYPRRMSRKDVQNNRK